MSKFRVSSRYRTFCKLCKAAVIALLAALLLLAGCARSPGEISASPGQQFTLAPGQTASIAGEPLKIRFVEVVNDSRCPSGVTCIWEGQASCLVELTYQDSMTSLVLTQRGSGKAATDFKDYNLEFEVQPYPEAGKTIAKQDYRLQMVVTRIPALAGGILATFQVIDEQYSIFITNKGTIEQVFALQRGESRATIPSGRLVRGAVPYNTPWGWHIDPEEVGMAEVTIELCDGKPSQVEADLDYWVDTVRYFCPWSARLVTVKDFR